jgi:hypothetical protein
MWLNKNPAAASMSGASAKADSSASWVRSLDGRAWATETDSIVMTTTIFPACANGR